MAEPWTVGKLRSVLEDYDDELEVVLELENEDGDEVSAALGRVREHNGVCVLEGDDDGDLDDEED
jgi:hypothetical protein